MPPTTPKVKTRFTNTKGERVTVMTDGTKTRVPATPAPTAPVQNTPPAPRTDVPVSSIENATTPVQVPQPQLDPTQAIDTAVTGSEAITTKMIADAEAQKKAAETQQSATDTRIKELFGLQGKAPEMKQKFEKEQDLEEKQRLANQIKAKADLVSQQRQLFNIDTENMTVSGMLGASEKDITKRTFSAMDTRNRLERALESNRQASELIGLNAQFQIAAGDVKLAQDSVALAMETFYKPIEAELEMQKLFFQRNENRMSEAQRGLAEAKKTAIDRQFKEIDDAKVEVSAAVATGIASDNDIAEMNALSGNPKAQREYAQKIIARASRAEMQRQKVAADAARSSQAWSQRANAYELAMKGDPAAIDFLGFDPRETGMSIEDTFNYMNETMEYDRILANLDNAVKSDAAIDASTGVTRSSLATAASRFGGVGLLAGGAAGSVVPAVGTAVGSFGGFLAGTATGVSQVANAKKDMLASLSALSNTAAFNKLMEYKARGVTVGQLTEGERIAIGRAAADLFAAIEIQSDGTVTRVNVSPTRYRQLVAAYKTEIEEKKRQKAEIYGRTTMNTADEDLINAIPTN